MKDLYTSSARLDSGEAKMATKSRLGVEVRFIEPKKSDHK
jgi:hypothetical protein